MSHRNTGRSSAVSRRDTSILSIENFFRRGTFPISRKNPSDVESTPNLSESNLSLEFGCSSTQPSDVESTSSLPESPSPRSSFTFQPSDVGSTSNPSGSKLPAEFFLELCDTLKAPEWHETLVTVSQVCRWLQIPAIMAYTGFHESRFTAGVLGIENTHLSALPQLIRIMSRYESGIQRLVIAFRRSPERILHDIRHLNHLAQFIPSESIPSIEFGFKLDLPPDADEARQVRVDFAAALKQGSFVDICQKCIGATDCGQNPRRTTVIARPLNPEGTSLDRSSRWFCDAEVFDNQTNSQWAHLLQTVAFPEGREYGVCQLRKTPGGERVIIMNKHAMGALDLHPSKGDWISLLPLLDLPALERLGIYVGPQTDLSTYFHFLECHKERLRHLHICVVDGTVPTPSFSAITLPSLTTMAATAETMATLSPVLNLPHLLMLSLDCSDWRLKDLEAAFQEISKFTTLEHLEFQQVSRSLFAALAPPKAHPQIGPRFLLLNQLESKTSRAQRGLMYALKCCFPGPSTVKVVLSHPADRRFFKFTSRHPILEPEVIDAVKREFPQVNLIEEID